jgi:hypothetical protein
MTSYEWISVILSAAIAYFTWTQVRIHNENLKLELYSRRFEVYDSVRLFLARAISDGDVKPPGDLGSSIPNPRSRVPVRD